VIYSSRAWTVGVTVSIRGVNDAHVWPSTASLLLLLYWATPEWSVAVLTIWCETSLSLAFLEALYVDPEVQGLEAIIDCPQPGILGRTTGLLHSAGGLSASNPAKFHPDPIWNYGALGFFGEVAANKKKNMNNNNNNNKMKIEDQEHSRGDSSIGLLNALWFSLQAVWR